LSEQLEESLGLPTPNVKEIARTDTPEGAPAATGSSKDLPTFVLYHPRGFAVPIKGQGRRDVLLKRGWTSTPPKKKASR
jgi:hypothetical protein